MIALALALFLLGFILANVAGVLMVWVWLEDGAA